MNWTIHRDSVVAWKEMLDACKNAQETVDLEQFIFVPDDIGKQFLDVCIEKAQQGVRVRLLWDAAGSFSFFGAGMIEDLKKKGVHLRFFKALIPRNAWNHRLWFFRDHRRSLVVDGRIAFTGSASIWEETHDWTETHIKVTGPIVFSITETFEQMWRRADTKTYRWNKQTPRIYGDIAYVTNSPIRKMRFLYKEIYDALEKAEKSICITTPYFCPDRTMLRQLLKARKRDVVIKLILPEQSDHFFVDLGAYSFFNRLLKAGVRIFFYEKGMIHSKSIIVDDTWATTGTLNFDNVSLRYNFEANIVTTNPQLISDLKTIFQDDLNASKEVTQETWKTRPLIQKVFENLILPFRPLL